MSDVLKKRLLSAWPFVMLVLLAVVFVLMLTFSRKAPLIASLEPSMAAPGSQIVVRGDYFGRTPREGSLSLAGEIPPPSLIKSWSDQQIVFLVPEDATSGLVSVSNSQGTSAGVLFTNTESIPTVLQAASPALVPLLVAAVPPQPAAGQVVTLLGRGFGTGDPRSSVQLTFGKTGPVFELSPQDCLTWSERSLSFRWPAGAGADSTVQVSTSSGTTAVFPVSGVSPLTYETPLTITVEVKVSTNVDSGSPLVLWAPVPQGVSGTAWKVLSTQPTPVSQASSLVFRWAAGVGGERRAVYRLSLTSWNRRWVGLPSGPTGETPKGDERPLLWWKSSLPAVKLLTAKWGLETSDPWVRVQRIQTGLSAFRLQTGGGFALSRPPAEILASNQLDSTEASSLAAVIAAQTGIPARLVSGLWLAADGTVAPRVWNELWLTGAGWIPWDVLDGSPGSLDNRHFAFETTYAPPIRLESKARTLGPSAPWGQGEPAGEAVWTAQEPVVQWEIKRTDK